MASDEERNGEAFLERKRHQEADLVANRLEELRENPIQGAFDAQHLKDVHAYIFQDLPHHRPGVIRDDTAETWIKHRGLEGVRGSYDVPYLSQNVEHRIEGTLQEFAGPGTIKGLAPEEVAGKIAKLYGDLDHAHGFYEGNSRTLREFTRELADQGGFDLDWTGTSVGTNERNKLYVARDLAVLERAYPDLTTEKAATTNDRAEYEASFLLEKLRAAAGENDLTAIVRDRLEPQEHVAERKTGLADRPLHVMDSATDHVSKLSDFITDFLAGAPPAAEPEKLPAYSRDPEARAAQRYARAAAQRDGQAAENALESIREDMQAGRNLKAEDVRSLTRQHQEQIRTFGDSAVREMVDTARKNDERFWRGDERDRDR